MRIACLFCLVTLAMVLSGGMAPAQESEKKRMTFQPGSEQPDPTPEGQSEKPSQDRGTSSPDKMIELFFLALQADKVEGGYDALMRDTVIATRPEDVAALKARTQEALDNYGPVRGYEVIEDLAVGKSLLRRTCISLNTDLPLRWRFYFYKTPGGWRLVDLRVDDALVELFEDAAKRQP